ncbi:hypothetical protein PLICRDRAFT_91014 [Plicaturopsis crispa FD-325 SS-3]|nr:hypothetical protein PLICRDRAFT_91014 [Plicaturopsis crispa FD-325 SS-3]
MTAIVLPSGLALQARISAPKTHPREEGTGGKLAILLHPWSWLGGNMNDPTLSSLVPLFVDSGYRVIRYNSRGVGRSRGWASFTGLSEAQDLQEVIQWALNTYAPRSVVILGFSHGSLIASLQPVLPQPEIKTSHILLSYPLGPRSFLTLFKSSAYTAALKTLLRDKSSNVLVVYGDRDEFTSVQSYDAWAEELEKAAQPGGETAGSLSIVKVPDGSHFWGGECGSQMQRAVSAWLPS